MKTNLTSVLLAVAAFVAAFPAAAGALRPAVAFAAATARATRVRRQRRHLPGLPPTFFVGPRLLVLVPQKGRLRAPCPLLEVAEMLHASTTFGRRPA